MFKHILVAIDGSPAAAGALGLADRLAAERLTVLTVVPDYTTADFARAVFLNHPDMHDLRDSLAQAGRQVLDAALAGRPASARPADRLVAVSNDPASEIVEASRRERCDLIVMGSRGRGRIASALLGSQAQRVLAAAPVPVLVCPAVPAA